MSPKDDDDERGNNGFYHVDRRRHHHAHNNGHRERPRRREEDDDDEDRRLRQDVVLLRRLARCIVEVPSDRRIDDDARAEAARRSLADVERRLLGNNADHGDDGDPRSRELRNLVHRALRAVDERRQRRTDDGAEQRASTLRDVLGPDVDDDETRREEPHDDDDDDDDESLGLSDDVPDDHDDDDDDDDENAYSRKHDDDEDARDEGARASEEEILQSELREMAARLKAHTTGLNETLRSQNTNIAALEDQTSRNLDSVSRVASDAEEAAARRSWTRSATRWFLLLSTMASFVGCFLTMRIVPRRRNACLLWCDDHYERVEERERRERGEERQRERELYEAELQREREAAAYRRRKREEYERRLREEEDGNYFDDNDDDEATVDAKPFEPRHGGTRFGTAEEWDGEEDDPYDNDDDDDSCLRYVNDDYGGECAVYAPLDDLRHPLAEERALRRIEDRLVEELHAARTRARFDPRYRVTSEEGERQRANKEYRAREIERRRREEARAAERERQQREEAETRRRREEEQRPAREERERREREKAVEEERRRLEAERVVRERAENERLVREEEERKERERAEEEQRRLEAERLEREMLEEEERAREEQEHKERVEHERRSRRTEEVARSESQDQDRPDVGVDDETKREREEEVETESRVEIGAVAVDADGGLVVGDDGVGGTYRGDREDATPSEPEEVGEHQRSSEEDEDETATEERTDVFDSIDPLRDEEEFRALAQLGDAEGVRAHLERRPGVVRAVDKNGWSALHEAARGGHAEVVRILCAAGAVADDRADFGRGETASHLARAMHGDDHPASRALRTRECGGDGDAEEELRLAASRGDAEEVRWGLSRRPEVVRSVDENGWSALHEAAWAGRTEVVEILCDAGADVDAVDRAGRTAVFLARDAHGDDHPVVAALAERCGAVGIR